MITMLLIFGGMIISGLTVWYFQMPVSPEFAMLVTGLLILALRVYRALGISHEITHLRGSLTDKYTVVGMGGATKRTHNKIVREIDQENNDLDTLKKRLW